MKSYSLIQSHRLIFTSDKIPKYLGSCLSDAHEIFQRLGIEYGNCILCSDSESTKFYLWLCAEYKRTYVFCMNK